MEGQATALVKLERHRYITGLLEEIEKMEPGLFTPPDPVDKDDEVIGEVTSDYLKKIYTAAMFSRKEFDQLAVEHKYAPHEEGKECPTEVKLTRARYRADALLELFWACVQDDLGYHEDSLGLRKGWKVIAADPADRARRSLFGLLGRLGGQEI